MTGFLIVDDAFEVWYSIVPLWEEEWEEGDYEYEERLRQKPISIRKKP